ncbi:MAG TPA: magnesium/cobalt transporter CorA [Solirubrobacteraceae bacterium]|nr:magnesium/cobalt transporter CorA [Solirubrobacteraceae bacterium]
MSGSGKAHSGSDGRNGGGEHAGMKMSCFTDVDSERLKQQLHDDEFFWLDLQDPSDQQIEQLGEIFGFHPLALEDSRSFDQRPKLDDYEDYMFLVFYGACEGQQTDEQLLREVHLFVSGGYVVTLHHGEIKEFHGVRERTTGQELRSEQFLIYLILDAVTDTFFPLLERIDEEIDAIEDAVIADPGEGQLQRIFALKRKLVALRRVVTPQRDIFARGIDRISELPGLQTDERDYFRDVYDHLIRISDLVDSYRDLLSGATDMHLSTVANRQGEVSKQLTIIATIFLPLTFITGFFGQNFAYLTSHVIDSTWSFLVFGLGSLVISCLLLLVYFKRKGWL